MADQRFEVDRRRFLQGAVGLAALAAMRPWPALGSLQPAQGVVALSEGKPEDAGMSSDRLEDVFARIQLRVNDGWFPGATALVARHGAIVGHRAFGSKAPGAKEDVTLDTLFDLESMTKVLSTATSAMILVQQGKLSLNDKVAKYLPDFAANGKESVTVRDMLCYSAGLPVDNQFLDNPNAAEVWKLMAETKLEYETGAIVEYSDLTYRLLGRLIEAVAGMDLNKFAGANVWQPLGMKDTMYNPPASLKPRVAATAKSDIRGYLVRAEVQDEQDFKLGGIVGCDGLFSTTMDIAVFCQMFLNGGAYNGVQVLKPEIVAEMVKNQTPQVAEAGTDTSLINNLILTPKGYGWELFTHRFSSGGMRLSPGSYGKAGGAGTFMWVDPARDLFGILLTNHGLPVPFDEPGWDRLIRDVGVAEFFDGIINAVADAPCQ